jgi:malonyl-CoA O-methyltransferase
MPLGPGSSDITPTMIAPPRIPARIETVARQFDIRVERLARADVLLREVDQRLQGRLDYVRLEAREILDAGCGRGRSRQALLARYPGARWIGVDLSARMARAGVAVRSRMFNVARWWRREDAWIVADAARLPLADQSVDLLYSNLMLHWHPTPHVVFPEWRRVLRVDGLLMFSCFGPDTLAELRLAAAEALPDARPMPFVDMHDFGDMMIASGFATPVMDVERLTLTFADPRDLLREVRALGGNPRDDRQASLPSGRRARRLLDALSARRDATGRIPLTFEVAYGHAWKPAERTAGVSVIPVDDLRRQLAGGRK